MRDRRAVVEHPLFVYGSLLRGEPNHRELGGAALLGPAVTEPLYGLVDLGAFPALVRFGTVAVQGELYLATRDDLRRLDAFEGEAYTRAPVSVRGGTEAHAYFLRGAAPAGAPFVASGSWRRYRAAKLLL